MNMNAIYAASADTYGMSTRPKPKPERGDAIVKVAAAGLCPNEVRLRSGVLRTASYPVIPGHQFSGTVESRGPDVKYLRDGDRVAVHPYVVCGECSVCRSGGPTHDCERFRMIGMSLDGGFAEYCRVPARFLYKLPVSVTCAEGALIENLANAVSTMRNAQPAQGERIVVFGSWSPAMLVLRIARLHNPRTLILAGTGRRRLALAETYSADATVDLALDDAASRLADLLEGRGAGIVVLCGPSAAEFELATGVVGVQGRIVIDGHVDQEARLTLPPIGELVGKAVTLKTNRGFKTADYAEAHRMASDGQADLKSLVTYRYGLADWESAFDAFTDPARESVQVLIEP
jgi:threonine dehydrogenase-like Zn-dependent dehydrogenase